MSVAAARGRIATALAEPGPAGLPALVPYVTAGFPRLDSTGELLLAAERAGCAAAELGIPFSDPLADGPTIQRSSQRALDNGMSPRLALEQLAGARAEGLRLPVAVMTYVNPILARGTERFCAEAVSSGADALIVPDLPVSEARELAAAAAAAGLGFVPLVAPTTTGARLREAAELATGFVYCVGVVGVTGARSALAPEALELLGRVGRVTGLPRALGFGLSRHEHLVALRGRAEAAVVGSALIDALAGPAPPAEAAESFLAQMRGPR